MARKQKLTPKQEAFVREYLIDLNATQAAIRAGYSPKTARVVGSENLTKPDIERAIAEAQGAREKRLDISADHVLEELARIAFADTTSAIRVEDGRVVVQDTDEMDENTRRAISEISETVTTNGGTLKVKFHDKVKALELLGKHLGLFPVNGRLQLTLPAGEETVTEEEREGRRIARRLIIEEIREARKDIPDGEGE